jgi:hypothetical protein
MTREQFLRKLRTWSRNNGLTYAWQPGEGKGSHGIVYVGTTKTIVKHGQLTPTYVRVILKQLQIPPGAI